MVYDPEFVRNRTLGVYRVHPVRWFGPFWVGACLDLIFLGISFGQARRYYTRFPKDSVWIKRLVGICLFLSVLKGIESIALPWEMNIANYGDWDVALSVHWTMALEPFNAAVLTAAAQSFFVWRCFTLSGKSKPILVMLVIGMVLVLGISLAMSIQYMIDAYHWTKILMFAVPMVVLTLALDLSVTIIVSRKLSRSMRDGYCRNTNTVLKKWLAITWEAALLPVVGQLVTILVFVGVGTRSAAPWYSIPNMLVARLYVFSMLFTLNARASIRDTTSTHSTQLSSGATRTSLRDAQITRAREKSRRVEEGPTKAPAAVVRGDCT